MITAGKRLPNLDLWSQHLSVKISGFHKSQESCREFELSRDLGTAGQWPHRPQKLIVTEIAVPPVSIRPSVVVGNSRTRTVLGHQLICEQIEIGSIGVDSRCSTMSHSAIPSLQCYQSKGKNGSNNSSIVALYSPFAILIVPFKLGFGQPMISADKSYADRHCSLFYPYPIGPTDGFKNGSDMPIEMAMARMTKKINRIPIYFYVKDEILNNYF
ncbi:hypothetical protein ZEAMMB73_Zm00001d006729 [Zea mays]|uniref:Uncharacterized protein n=1 Tax=Zea mays TaxID=4577 RepID=A0A1D6F027_MAIZE|nr:hypothetical protein ZEAMMB73_Zm00001d006729 [Zea mays]